MSSIDIHTVNPYIRVALRSVLKKGYIIKRRVIFDYELVYIEDGGMLFHYDGIAYPCERGQFLLIRPGIPHSFDCREQTLSQPHIHFDMIYTADSKKTPVSFKDLPMMSPTEKALIQKDLFCEFPKTPFISFANIEEVISLFYKVIDCFAANRPLEAKGALTSLLSDLINDNFAECLSQRETCYGIARQLRDLIDSTHGVGISLDSLEKQFSYSKFHLERQFQREYGVSLIAYVNKKRMQLAQELLTERKSVSLIAEEVGFSSIYAFSRAFKNRFGIPPSEYQKAMTVHTKK
ncbi:MAG: AraC family transcriptional regulator [Clostridia bacterium]|nr:AraC family transcriptional regulator [Clostridia bacterium]